MKALCLLLMMAAMCRAETGADAWLRYRPEQIVQLPAVVVALDDSQVETSAQTEIIRGIEGISGRTDRAAKSIINEDMIVLATLKAAASNFSELTLPADLIDDGYWLKSFTHNGHRVFLICGRNDRGVLYGAFEFLRRVVLHQELEAESNPYQTIRWVNEWDNLDGTIERGYAGKSIFFADGNVLNDLTRAGEYARLLASVGINGCTPNNVNANARVLTPEFLPQLVRLAAVFRPWGVRMSISVPFSSPRTVGGLDTFDPKEERVKNWWKAKADELYTAIPDLAGFVVKADSEGQLGPSTYGRTHAEAANVLADALRPHGGIVIYRGFVYNHHLDWHDPKNDRAKAAYDNFHPLDGQFADNAILQIKYGPIDFQAREPVSPLLGALKQTNETMELQITQEYTGQQRHLCYLVPMWKQLLDFDMQVDAQQTPVHDIVSGKTFHRPTGGLVGVSNVGQDANWMGADLAMANLYGFGRLAWNPALSAGEITNDWVKMTWGDDPLVVKTISEMELKSWGVYESYTGPLGLGTLTDILHGHYGPGIETAEGNGWGQWIRADHQGIGMDRTVASGTGYIGQYSEKVAGMFESLEHCPDSLVLFMHHVPYSHVLHSGKTVVQSIYDSHYEGAAIAGTYSTQWQKLRGKVDSDRYDAVLKRLQYQAGHAVVWRDAICNWFMKQSGIPDKQGRVGHYPDRTEAEAMNLQGYRAVEVTPREDASGGKAISCPDDRTQCSATMQFRGPAGWYRVSVQYFDVSPGTAEFSVSVRAQLLKTWRSNADLPWKIPNGDTSARELVGVVALRPGDTIHVDATPDASDRAAVDYVEVSPVMQ